MKKNENITLPTTSEIEELYKKAIETDGNRDSLLDLGLCYLQGDGVQPDIDKGFFLMERSAKQGLPVAQYELGNCYVHGYGVDLDVERAQYWWKRAADQGFTKAQEALNR